MGLAVVPDEKNSTPGSDGWTEAARAAISAGSTSRPRATNASQPSIAPSGSPTVATWRRKGYLPDTKPPGSAQFSAGSSAASIAQKSFFTTRRSISRTETPLIASNWPSSASVEKVLNVVATPPASATPNTALRNSGRLVISTPTRVPWPSPQATSARATACAWSHSSA